MRNPNPVEIWLSKLEKRHSSSKNTERLYRGALERFCNFVGGTPEEIIEAWKDAKYDLRAREQFIDETLEKLDIYENYLGKQGLCKSSIATYLAGVASFFKYMRIDVKVDVYQAGVEYHNRDITKEEIKRIVNNASVRDKAFFLMMVQSGLRPVTLLQLTYGQIKEDFEADRIPCCIIVSRDQTKGEYVEHFTFMGEDAVRALKAYFRERGTPKDNETIFKGVETPNAFSMRFGYAVRSLELIKPENMREGGKPQPLRLYCLRKYFRTFAGPAGIDYVNFWMGHKTSYKTTVSKSDDSYFTHNIELHRKRYEEKAMPGLQIFEPSALETVQEIKELRQKVAELEREREEQKKWTITPEQWKTIQEQYREHIRIGKELDEKTKEALARLEEQNKRERELLAKIMKEAKVHAEIDEVIIEKGSITREEASEIWKKHHKKSEK